MSTDILALTSEAALLVRRGKVSFANAAAIKLFGADCVGKSVRSLLGEDIAGTQASSFIAGVNLGGESRIARVSRLDSGQVIFISAAETAPEALNQPFLFALRSGLMNIGISADIIRQWAEEQGQTELLANVSRLTRSQYRLARMALNAALFLDIGGGGLSSEMHLTNLSSMCADVLEAVSHFRPDTELHCELGSDISVPAASALIRQLLLNLISNCMIHASGCTRISVNLTETGSCAVLSVSDNGSGIEPEALHTVFDRYRHGFKLGAMGDGAGIGLTVCRRIAELHGGTLLLESRPGQGTTARVSLFKSSPQLTLRAAADDQAELTREVLIGLSGCLPEECYTEKYMD